MTKQATITIGAAVCLLVVGGLGVWIYNTTNEQNTTRKELEDLKQQMAQKQAGTAAGTPANVPGGGAPAGTEMAHAKSAQEVIDTGQALLDTKDRQKAETAAKLFQEAIDTIDAKNADFYSGLGRASLITGKLGDAAKAYKSALELKPKRADLWLGIATAYWGLKDYYHAKFAYEQAIAINPNSVDAWSVMAWVYMGLKDFENSKKGFEVLLASGNEPLEWQTGLTMARAGNTNLDQIRRYFPMPDPAAFDPPATSTAPGK